jgi:hypothetical protein
MYIKLNPATFNDIKFDGKWTETLAENRFLLDLMASQQRF